jgi:hypothetical protein
VCVEHPPTMEHRAAPADDGHGAQALQSERRRAAVDDGRDESLGTA